ncbi:MAG: hypothetical protein CBB78_003580 [Roseibacillus sp. TMED18]|nr:MAG: hypothetical protein CBB78_003580 [Roseibacillus sp. TMED18]
MSDSQNESRSTEVDEYYAKAGEKAKVGKKAKGNQKSVFSEKAVVSEEAVVSENVVSENVVSEKSKAGKKAVKGRSVGSWVFRILAGFEVAIICLLMLFAATFFGTLEQTQVGLYQTLQKYFDMEALFVIPELNGKIIPLPIPGTFWVSAVLVVNMTLGGLIRARKGWKTAGVLIAHFSMIFLLVAGGVSQISKKEGVMHVYQGDRSDYARSYTEPTIEIYPIGDKGQRDRPFVVDTKHLTGLKSEESLTVRLPEGLPFDLKVTGFLRSSDLLQVGRAKDQYEGERVVDGFFLKETKRAQQEETNLTGCYLTVLDKDGVALQEMVLHYNGMLFPTPVTAQVNGEKYEFSLTRWIWPMPFEVELDKTLGEYWPGTRDPSWFQSDITKVEGQLREEYSIVMNKPMRHEGVTLYQASWAPPAPGGRPSSGFAIVQNPSDQWPKWSLYIASFGLMLHFGMKLTRFLGSSIPKKKSPHA